MTFQLIDTDAAFFRDHRDRQARIRNAIGDESAGEFMSLGPHDRARRRIIAWQVPRNAKMAAGKILKISFLVFSDESIRDDDETLLPILHEIIIDAANKHNIPVPKFGL